MDIGLSLQGSPEPQFDEAGKSNSLQLELEARVNEKVSASYRY
jgi:hypothetical protein